MWRRAQINSPAGTVPISVASSGGAKVVRANLSLSSNGLIDFQDGSSNSLNGGPIPLLAGYPFELGYVDNDDAQQNPVFATGGAGGDAFPFTGSAIDWDFANGRYSPALGLTTTRASVAYEDDLSGNWTSFAANTARITNKGLLVEESRTNGLRNNSMQGAVVGTPGTLPTDWLSSSNSTLTRTIVGVGTESGIDYIDIQFSGTVASNGLVDNTVFETQTAIAALQGQTWSGSAFVKLVGGSTLNTSFRLIVLEYNSSGTQIGADPGGFVPVTTNALGTGRLSMTTTLAQAACAFVALSYQLSYNTGPVNITLRIGWPQLELGTFATSPIRTTAAAVTRAADVITVTSPPTFGSAFTLFGVGTPIAPVGYAASNQTVVEALIDSNNRCSMFRNNTSSFPSVVEFVGGTNVFQQGPSPAWVGTGKIAVAVQANDQAAAFNGSLFPTGNNPASFVPTTITIGARQIGATTLFDGYITRVAVWPNQRLPNATLQSITSPGPANTNALNLVIQGAGTCTGYVDYQLTSGN